MPFFDDIFLPTDLDELGAEAVAGAEAAARPESPGAASERLAVDSGATGLYHAGFSSTPGGLVSMPDVVRSAQRPALNEQSLRQSAAIDRGRQYSEGNQQMQGQLPLAAAIAGSEAATTAPRAVQIAGSPQTRKPIVDVTVGPAKLDPQVEMTMGKAKLDMPEPKKEMDPRLKKLFMMGAALGAGVKNSGKNQKDNNSLLKMILGK